MSWRARLSKSMNELRIVYCAQSASSQGTREFIKKNYTDIKALNPGLPVYIRPADGVQPHIAARYGSFPLPVSTPFNSKSRCEHSSISNPCKFILFGNSIFAANEERGVYETRSTSGMSADQVLAQVEHLEAAAESINAKSTGGGIGGSEFKIADIV